MFNLFYNNKLARTVKKKKKSDLFFSCFVCVQDIAFNKVMTVLVSIREDIKDTRKEILKIQKDIEEIKEHIGTHHENKESPGPALILPLKTVDDFMDAETQLQTKAVRCKTVSTHQLFSY